MGVVWVFGVMRTDAKMCTFFKLVTYAEFKRKNKIKNLIEKIKVKILVSNLVYTKDAYTKIAYTKMREKF